jgi:3-hydroxybutyryl-CoA dehydrogenase
MFGYACDETPELMPAPIYYAHRLVERQAQLRKDGRLPFLRPDAKSQVTMRYVDGKPHSIDTVVLSSQHSPEMSDGTKMKPAFIEAVIEDEAIKAGIFSQLDQIVTDPDAVLASNTSSIPIMKLAAATGNPGRVLGLHFFNPVPVLPLVELVTTLVTDEAAAARTEQFAATALGKQVVRCGDRSGFVVNALLVPYLLSAVRMVESGFATVDDVDVAVVAGLSHPMGPLRLSDLIGLDTLKLIADKMYEEFKEPLYSPPPLLLRMVEAGRLGKKSGRGFYTY